MSPLHCKRALSQVRVLNFCWGKKKRKEYKENVLKWKSMMSLAFSLFFWPFLTKKWNFDQITPIHAQIGYTLNWYSALAFLRLSPSELLCSGCLPSDVFIFNWGVITPVCITARLGKKKKKKHLRERRRTHLPEQQQQQPHPQQPPASFSWRAVGPHDACWPWWL